MGGPGIDLAFARLLRRFLGGGRCSFVSGDSWLVARYFFVSVLLSRALEPGLNRIRSGTVYDLDSFTSCVDLLCGSFRFCLKVDSAGCCVLVICRTSRERKGDNRQGRK